MTNVVELVSDNPEYGSIEAELLRELMRYADEIAESGKMFTFEQPLIGGPNSWLQTPHHDTGNSLAAMGPYRRGLITTMLEERFQDIGGNSQFVRILPLTKKRPEPPVYQVIRSDEGSLVVFTLYPMKR